MKLFKILIQSRDKVFWRYRNTFRELQTKWRMLKNWDFDRFTEKRLNGNSLNRHSPLLLILRGTLLVCKQNICRQE